MRWRGGSKEQRDSKGQDGEQSELETQGQEPQLPVLLRDPNRQADGAEAGTWKCKPALAQDSEGVAWVIVPMLKRQTKVLSRTAIEPDSSMNTCQLFVLRNITLALHLSPKSLQRSSHLKR